MKKEKKNFDAVEFMRRARQQLSEEYRTMPREAFLKQLQERYGQDAKKDVVYTVSEKGYEKK